jgi:HSF-type DNA-binding
MFPGVPPSSSLHRIIGNDDGADASLPADAVAASLNGGLSSLLLNHHFRNEIALRSAILASDVQSRSLQSDLLTKLVARDSLRKALLSRHLAYSNPFEQVTSTLPYFALAQKVQQDALINQAFKLGQEEALKRVIGTQVVSGIDIPVTANFDLPSSENLPSDKIIPHSEFDIGHEVLFKEAPSGFLNDAQDKKYFDASTLSDPDEATLANRRTRGGVTEPFPEKLHRLLDDCEERGETEVISFLPHGRAFIVHHVERFCREVMPRYFKQSRLSSFQRQLNLYGFRRITTGQDSGGYYHELFLKGRPALAIHMRRVGICKPGENNNRSSCRSSSATQTPDFYKMAPLSSNNSDDSKLKAQP